MSSLIAGSTEHNRGSQPCLTHHGVLARLGGSTYVVYMQWFELHAAFSARISVSREAYFASVDRQFYRNFPALQSLAVLEFATNLEYIITNLHTLESMVVGVGSSVCPHSILRLLEAITIWLRCSERYFRLSLPLQRLLSL